MLTATQPECLDARDTMKQILRDLPWYVKQIIQRNLMTLNHLSLCGLGRQKHRRLSAILFSKPDAAFSLAENLHVFSEPVSFSQ